MLWQGRLRLHYDNVTNSATLRASYVRLSRHKHQIEAAVHFLPAKETISQSPPPFPRQSRERREFCLHNACRIQSAGGMAWTLSIRPD